MEDFSLAALASGHDTSEFLDADVDVVSAPPLDLMKQKIMY